MSTFVYNCCWLKRRHLWKIGHLFQRVFYWPWLYPRCVCIIVITDFKFKKPYTKSSDWLVDWNCRLAASRTLSPPSLRNESILLYEQGRDYWRTRCCWCIVAWCILTTCKTNECFSKMKFVENSFVTYLVSLLNWFLMLSSIFVLLVNCFIKMHVLPHKSFLWNNFLINLYSFCMPYLLCRLILYAC